MEKSTQSLAENPPTRPYVGRSFRIHSFRCQGHGKDDSVLPEVQNPSPLAHSGLLGPAVPFENFHRSKRVDFDKKNNRSFISVETVEFGRVLSDFPIDEVSIGRNLRVEPLFNFCVVS